MLIIIFAVLEYLLLIALNSVKEKENKTLITPQIFDQIINNYQKIEHIENFSNKVKTYLNELSAEKQYNILTDIFIDNELKNNESLQTKKRL